MTEFWKKLVCWWKGHDWSWVYDDSDFEQYRAGNCQRCGEIGAGLIPSEPEYESKEDSCAISRKGFNNTPR